VSHTAFNPAGVFYWQERGGADGRTAARRHDACSALALIAPTERLRLSLQLSARAAQPAILPV
jgi:hypothetical protein